MVDGCRWGAWSSSLPSSGDVGDGRGRPAPRQAAWRTGCLLENRVTGVEETVEKHADTSDDHRRVIPVVTFREGR
jgi:hypothetical protein